MLIGLEYVVAAYGIWVGTFVVYIFFDEAAYENCRPNSCCTGTKIFRIT